MSDEDGADPREDRAGDPAARLLTLIGDHGPSIREVLDDERYALLLARVRGLADTPPGDGRALRRAMQGVRQALVPLPLDHPARRALDSARLVAAPPGPAAVDGARELLTRLTPRRPAPADPAPEADRHLLRAARTLSAAEAHARCGGTLPPGLIRLPDPHDGDRYPEFQFADGAAGPYPVVLEVNRLLLADIDPWGAAAWWLDHNTWLGGAPARLLGRLPDHRLAGAAMALAEGD